MNHEELAVRARKGDRAARDTLWEAVQRLCHHLARRYFPLCAQAGIDPEDLSQELYFAFLAALDAFDPTSGNKFTSYLQYPVWNVCAAALGIRNGKRLRPVVSLQRPVGDEDSALQDLLEDPAGGQPFEDAEHRLYLASLHTALHDCLNALDDRQAATIRARYYDGLTLAEIGARLGCSAEYARQLENKGLRRLRCPQFARRLRAHLLTEEAYHGTGFTAWKRGGSVQERAVIHADERAGT